MKVDGCVDGAVGDLEVDAAGCDVERDAKVGVGFVGGSEGDWVRVVGSRCGGVLPVLRLPEANAFALVQEVHGACCCGFKNRGRDDWLGPRRCS